MVSSGSASKVLAFIEPIPEDPEEIVPPRQLLKNLTSPSAGACPLEASGRSNPPGPPKRWQCPQRP